MLELAFRADPGRSEPIYVQLAGYLRALIEAGRLLPGERFPSTRELADQLGVSRNTVSHAYTILADEEMLTSHVGQGTFVAARARPPSAPIDASASTDAEAPRGFAWEGLLAERLGRLVPARGMAPLQGDVRFDFAGGRVDPALQPLSDFRRAWSRAVAESMPLLAKPFSPLGLPALREEISLLLVSRGIACEPEDVLVTNGVHQAFDLVARALVDPGDTVVVEQPGYFGSTLAFRASGARLVGVSVDDEGLCVGELARVLRVRRAKLVYVTPSAQSPTGVVLSERRRNALLELSDLHQVPIFEDDYDREARFEGPALPALKTRDLAGRVIYAGTFSKALFPGLRVGYVVAARPLLARLAMLRAVADLATDGVSQLAVLDLLTSGALERHVRRLRRLHARRREAMLAALERTMPRGTRVSRPAGGHAVWVTLPPGVDGEALQHAALAQGIVYGRGDFFSLDGSFRDSFALSFVNQSEDRIEAGVAALARLVEAASGPGKAAALA